MPICVLFHMCAGKLVAIAVTDEKDQTEQSVRYKDVSRYCVSHFYA